MEGFKAQTRNRQGGGVEGSNKGTLSTLWDQGGGGELFLKIWEKIMRFVEENLRLTIILIIIVSSSSFLMFYPKFMIYQTFIML